MSACVKRQVRAVRFWTWVGASHLAKKLRPLGLRLRDAGCARHVHKIWDMRKTNGQYWEMYGWGIGPIVIPFSVPRRNTIEEMTTPEVLRFWAKLRERYGI